jgi:hypothetical protein
MINTRDEFATEYIARAIGMPHIELVTVYHGKAIKKFIASRRRIHDPVSNRVDTRLPGSEE